MIFWSVAGVMVLAAGALILRALTRAPVADMRTNPDMAVYRAQLAEVDRDLSRDIIAATEAEAMRTEIKRRMLELDRAGAATAPAARRLGNALPAGLTCLMLLAAVLLYWELGAPGYADLPHRDRVARAEAVKAARPTQTEAEAEAAKGRAAPPAPPEDFAKLMDDLRAAVAERPDDVQGLRLLATNERRIGNLQAAARAEERLLVVLGDTATADDHAALADILISAAGGLVTADAEAQIAAALRTDPANGTARFYAGLLEAQIGRPDRAFLLWRALQKDSPPEAPWMPYIAGQMEMLAAAAGADYAPPEVKGPGAADIDAAAQMSEGDRAEMIKGMVAGLEERLFTQSGTAGEWAQLMTALGVLGDKDRAQTAWARAQVALQGDPAALDQVRAAAQTAGVSE